MKVFLEKVGQSSDWEIYGCRDLDHAQTGPAFGAFACLDPSFVDPAQTLELGLG